jgi:multisubunit Na+/H+ antiporter MnhB subunit
VAGSDYAETERVVPMAVGKLVFPPRGWVLKALGAALVLAAAALVLVARRRPDLALTGAVVAVGSGVSLLAGIWFGAGEYWRFGIQEAIGLRLAVLIAVVAAVDVLLVAWRLRSPHEARSAPEAIETTASGAP